jgi:ribosomal protein S19E (S16A)
VSSSVTSLNRQMREEDFMNELGVIEKNINEALVRAGLAEPEETEQNVVLETGRSKLQNRRGGAR